MSNNVNLNIKAKMSSTFGELNKLNGAFQNLGKNTDNAGKSYGKFIKDSKKINNSFQNMTKDVNRASNSIGNMTKGFFSLSGVIKTVGIGVLGHQIAQAIQSNVEMIETIHLFEVAMGEFAETTDLALQNMSKLTGLDHTNLQNRVATYNLLARSMGMSAKNASILSENSNKLANDLASLTNTSITQVSQDIRSGLIGQSRTMYKYGIDVTESALKVEALSQGITKSVRLMSQGEKMALRYSLMVKQAGLSHGDFAVTINTPANQLKIMSERFVTLTRAIGSLFIPMLSATLPYLNALLQVLTKIISTIAIFIGYKPPESVKNSDNGFGTMADDADLAEDSVNKTTKAVKKLRSVLGGFDEINVLADPNSGSGGGKGKKDEGSGSPFDMDLIGYDNMVDSINQKSDEIAEKMQKFIGRFVELSQPLVDADFKPLMDSLDKLYDSIKRFGEVFGQGLEKFYTEVLVPLGVWAITDVLPNVILAFDRFVEVMTKVGEEFLKINFQPLLGGIGRLWEAIKPFSSKVGDGLEYLLLEILVPLGVWAIETIVPKMLELLAESFKVLTSVLEVLNPIFKFLLDYIIIPLVKSIGKGLVKVLEWSIEKLKDLQKWVDKNEGAMAFWTTTIGLFVGALVLMTNPIGGVVIAILGLIGAGDELKVSWDELKENLSKMWEDLKTNIGKSIDKLKGTMVTKWNDIDKAVNKIVNKLVDDTIRFWSELPSKIGYELGKFAGTLATWGVNAVGWVAIEVPKIIAEIIRFMAEVPNKIKEKLDLFKSTISTWTKDSISWFSSDLPKIINKIVDIMKNIPNRIKEKLDLFKHTISTWVTDSIKWSDGQLPRLLNSIVNWFAKLPNSMINIGSNMIKGLWNGIVNMGSWFSNKISGFLGKIGEVAGDVFGGVGRGFKETYRPPQRFAKGGTVSAGQLFEAGEFGKAELVGNYNGQTTVMPLENSGFIGAMERAVIRGVSNAMKSNGGDSGTPIVVNVGGKTLVDTVVGGINRDSRIKGKTVITV